MLSGVCCTWYTCPSLPGLHTPISPICHDNIALHKCSIFGFGSHWMHCAFPNNPMGVAFVTFKAHPSPYLLCLAPEICGTGYNIFSSVNRPSWGQRPRRHLVNHLCWRSSCSRLEPCGKFYEGSKTRKQNVFHWQYKLVQTSWSQTVTT